MGKTHLKKTSPQKWGFSKSGSFLVDKIKESTPLFGLVRKTKEDKRTLRSRQAKPVGTVLKSLSKYDSDEAKWPNSFARTAAKGSGENA